MLLANSSVRKAAKTARVCQYATRGSIQGIVGIALLQSNGRKGRSPFNGWRPVPPSLFIQNHCAKSENPWFFKTNSGNVNEPLMWEVRFLSETDNGDFRVCQYASIRRFACATFLAPKSLRQIGKAGFVFWGTNSGSTNEPLMGGSFFVG